MGKLLCKMGLHNLYWNGKPDITRPSSNPVAALHGVLETLYFCYCIREGCGYEAWKNHYGGDT